MPSDIQMLKRQARAAYGSNNILAAYDFYTHHVSCRLRTQSFTILTMKMTNLDDFDKVLIMTIQDFFHLDPPSWHSSCALDTFPVLNYTRACEAGWLICSIVLECPALHDLRARCLGFFRPSITTMRYFMWQDDSEQVAQYIKLSLGRVNAGSDTVNT